MCGELVVRLVNSLLFDKTLYSVHGKLLRLIFILSNWANLILLSHRGDALLFVLIAHLYAAT